MWKNKKVLVTGSQGMIGKELVKLLNEQGADIREADYKFDKNLDLRDYSTCKDLCKGMDYVFHLAGIKGSPKMTEEQPASFMLPMLQFDTNMIRAAQENNVERFLYTSSIAVLNPQTDKYPAWAKKTGEMLCEAMRIEYPTSTQYCIVRPANVYGRFDNFKNPNAMVVSSLIRKFFEDDGVHVWGDGSEERDFINSRDVANCMILTLENMPIEPINACSRETTSIKTLVEAIRDVIGSEKPIVYEKGISRGDKRRGMPANGYKVGFKPKVRFKEGIREVVEYARDNFYSTN